MKRFYKIYMRVYLVAYTELHKHTYINVYMQYILLSFVAGGIFFAYNLYRANLNCCIAFIIVNYFILNSYYGILYSVTITAITIFIFMCTYV